MIDDSDRVSRMSGVTRNGAREKIMDRQPYPVDPYSAESADHIAIASAYVKFYYFAI